MKSASYTFENEYSTDNYAYPSISLYTYTKIRINYITIQFVYPNSNTATKQIKLNTETINLGVEVNTGSVTFDHCDGLIGVDIEPTRNNPLQLSFSLSGGIYTQRDQTNTSNIVLPGGVRASAYKFPITIDYEYDDIWKEIDYPELKDLQGYNNGPFPGWESPKPDAVWKIDGNNDGYPWLLGYEQTPKGGKIYYKNAAGLVPLTAFYKTRAGFVPIMYMGTKNSAM